MPLPSPQNLADTYNTPGYSDPWDAVDDYHRVISYTGDHPQKGSTAVSTALDLPRGRVRPWMNGSRPDVVHGIQTAEERGWLAEHTDSKKERGVVELAAWVLSGGTLNIGNSSHVYFSLDLNTRSAFDEIAERAGVPYNIIHEDDSKRGMEARPSKDGSVLARVLSAMGVPTGGKSSEGPDHLPAFVADLDAELRERFAVVYVRNRAAEHGNKATLTIREERPNSYLDELATLLQDVSGERVTHSSKNITISAAAAPELLEDNSS